MLLGVYDYTVILTYLSAISAGIGIFSSLDGTGHPYIGCFCLMACGIFDAFDGRVARMKKDRTSFEKKFGIQIDSLADLIAFGVLPACIGKALMENVIPEDKMTFAIRVVTWIVFVCYILAALIRLAYFNVKEDERQQEEEGCRKFYEGLPVTSSSMLFPFVLLLYYIANFHNAWLYLTVMVLTGVAFLSKAKIPKPGLRGILILMAIGIFDVILLIVLSTVRVKAGLI